MSSNVEKDVLDAGIGNELEGVLDERYIGQRKKTLIYLSLQRVMDHCSLCITTLGFSRVKGGKPLSYESVSTSEA